jgi:hypothetical protein
MRRKTGSLRPLLLVPGRLGGEHRDEQAAEHEERQQRHPRDPQPYATSNPVKPIISASEIGVALRASATCVCRVRWASAAAGGEDGKGGFTAGGYAG